MKRGRIVVVLSTPLTARDGSVFLSDRVHVQTLELLSERFREVCVVARLRTTAILADVEHVALDDTGARLAHTLPDYSSGSRPLLRALTFLFAPAQRQALQRLVAPAEVLYIESPSLESVLAWGVARRVRKPYIMEMRGDTPLNLKYMHSRFGPGGAIVSRVIAAFFGLFRRQAAAGVFVGHELRGRYAPAGAIAVVVSGVRLPDHCPRPPRTFAGPARRFLFVGHLEKVKALHVVLQALSRVSHELPSGWSLDLVGDGPERPNLEALARDLGMASQVRFHSRVPWGERLFAFYERSDMLLMASLTEGNSRTLIEALAFALPALSSAVGEAPRLLTPDALVPPGEVQLFAAALTRLANSPLRLGEVSRHNVAQASQYLPAELLRRRASFFDEVIASPILVQPPSIPHPPLEHAG